MLNPESLYLNELLDVGVESQKSSVSVDGNGIPVKVHPSNFDLLVHYYVGVAWLLDALVFNDEGDHILAQFLVLRFGTRRLGALAQDSLQQGGE